MFTDFDSVFMLVNDEINSQKWNITISASKNNIFFFTDSVFTVHNHIMHCYKSSVFLIEYNAYIKAAHAKVLYLISLCVWVLPECTVYIQ